MSDRTERSEGGTEAPPRYAEQITADPVVKDKEPKKKEKDPKKVAAGKKLAEYNKKAKEALAREMKREKEQEDIKNEESETKAENGKANRAESSPRSGGWFPELSFTTVLSIVGIGFTAFDMFMRYRGEYKNSIADLSQVPTQTFQAPPIKIHNPQPPKIGML